MYKSIPDGFRQIYRAEGLNGFTVVLSFMLTSLGMDAHSFGLLHARLRKVWILRNLQGCIQRPPRSICWQVLDNGLLDCFCLCWGDCWLFVVPHGSCKICLVFFLQFIYYIPYSSKSECKLVTTSPGPSPLASPTSEPKKVSMDSIRDLLPCGSDKCHTPWSSSLLSRTQSKHSTSTSSQRENPTTPSPLNYPSPSWVDTGLESSALSSLTQLTPWSPSWTRAPLMHQLESKSEKSTKESDSMDFGTD